MLLLIVIGFSTWANGLVAHHMKRMSVGSGWAYAYLAALAVGALPGCLFAAFCFLTAVFRPDRNPHIMVMLYDIGAAVLRWIPPGCFITMYLVFALAILLDKNKIFPKWLAYVTIWQIMTEVLAAPIFIFKSGPFAWNRCDQLLAGHPDLLGMVELPDASCSARRSNSNRPASRIQDF